MSLDSPLQTFYLLSLGCPKNRVDSEWVASDLGRAGLAQVADPDDADVLLVNTCAFIEPAIEESVEAVLEAVAYKESGRCRKVVLMGCLAQRYGGQLAAELPEVDLVVGCSDLGRLAQEVVGGGRGVMVHPGAPSYLPGRVLDREPSLGPHLAYLKVAEGCNRTCAFCTVPSIRGRQRSRNLSELVEEAKMLTDRGVREIVLVAQDLVTYGLDLGTNLHALVEKLAAIDGLDWLRAMYLYPSGVTEGLLSSLAQTCVPYLDLPIQHVSDRVLSFMNRHYDGRTVERVFDDIERIWPEAFIRITLLVGHPGEQAADFDKLVRFVEKQRIDHIGVFAYSREEGTASADQRPRPRHSTATRRRDELMALAKELSARRLATMVGRELDVLIDGPAEENLFVGRHQGQAPEVDGIVYVTGDERRPDGAAMLDSGDMVRVVIDQAGDYDLAGRVVGPVANSRETRGE